MFDRVKYKEFAKVQTKGRYKVPVLMILFTGFVMCVFDLPNLYYTLGSIDMGEYLTLSFMDKIDYLKNVPSNPALDCIDILKMIVGAIFTLASIHVYIKMSRSPDPVKFSDFIEGFSYWGRAVLCELWQALFIFLWSFVFIIPAIIKYYAYSQMFYLVDEFPEMSIRKAMKVSMAITKGHKMDLFVLDLSFIGWFILSLLTLGIGFFWTYPYCVTSLVAFYNDLKASDSVIEY